MAIEPLYTVKDGVRTILDAISNENSLDIKTVNLELLKLNNYIRIRGFRDLDTKERQFVQEFLKDIDQRFKEMLLICHNLQSVQNRILAEMMKWGMTPEKT